MNRMTGTGLAALGLLVAGAVGAAVVGSGVADGAPAGTRATQPATFQMFANVDHLGDLGSHRGAVSVKPIPGASGYTVTFSKPIGHCAAVVQPGKAGGPDDVDAAMPVVTANGRTSFDVQFWVPKDNGAYQIIPDPFMMTVTCPS